MNTIREGSQVLVDFSMKVMRKDISLGIFFFFSQLGKVVMHGRWFYWDKRDDFGIFSWKKCSFWK
jgi:hypothetical protein